MCRGSNHLRALAALPNTGGGACWFPHVLAKTKILFPAGNRIPDLPNSRSTLLNVDNMKTYFNILDGPPPNTAAEHAGGRSLQGRNWDELLEAE